MSFYAYVISDRKYYYFTGKVLDSSIKLRKTFKTVNALQKAITPLINSFYPHKVNVMYAKIAPLKKVKKGRSKNPIKKTAIEQAKKGYKKFTGHDAGYIDTVNVPQLKKGFVFGTCDGILYTTVRDGRTEKYIHEFKDSSRPVLASNYDGDFIALVGGNYKFTDSGIVDK